MPDRKSLVPTLWGVSTLALLASVLSAPIVSLGFSAVAFRPGCLRRNFALPSSGSPARLSPSANLGSAPPSADPRSGIDPEGRDQFDPPRETQTPCFRGLPFAAMPPFSRPVFLPARSAYPLRC